MVGMPRAPWKGVIDSRILLAWAFVVYHVTGAPFPYVRFEADRPQYERADVCEAARQGAAGVLGQASVSDRCEEQTSAAESGPRSHSNRERSRSS
jgi:hypothetical protein